jgi:hypothetical protein
MYWEVSSESVIFLIFFSWSYRSVSCPIGWEAWTEYFRIYIFVGFLICLKANSCIPVWNRLHPLSFSFSLHFNIYKYAVILIDTKYFLQLNYVRAIDTTRLQSFCWGDSRLVLPNCMFRNPPTMATGRYLFGRPVPFLKVLIVNFGARGSVVGWRTILQIGRSRVRIPRRSLDFSIYPILPAALWPWGRLGL